jgi:hypothetical protein
VCFPVTEKVLRVNMEAADFSKVLVSSMPKDGAKFAVHSDTHGRFQWGYPIGREHKESC